MREENISLHEEKNNLSKENVFLKKRVNELEEAIKHKKDSNNSSIPPSKDENRSKQVKTLREKSGIKVGGQKGHKGYGLKMTDTPDIIEDHIPEYCTKCGKPLESETVIKGRRQVIDIPLIQIQTTEHRIYSRQCSCGNCVQSEFPQQASNNVTYGNNLQTMIAYLSVRQYIPIKRIEEMLNQMLNVKLSQGTVVNIIKNFADKCKPIYNEIKLRIEKSHVVGSDETGCVVNGKKHWIWTWQNEKLSYLKVSENRGFQTIESNFENGLPNSILVHDCWSAHFKIKALWHQICIPHLLRELNYFIELGKNPWVNEFKQILLRALELKHEFLNNNYWEKVKSLKQIANKSINEEIEICNKKLIAFKKRMIKYEKYLFTFLDHFDVPPDNNGSERAIRNVKVKQKVSSQFKTLQGAQDFVSIRSVIDTCIKNNKNIFSTLSCISIS